MRDIRDDLRQRLAALDGAYADAMTSFQEQVEALHAKHNATVAQIGRERSALSLLLEAEERKSGGASVSTVTRSLVPLSDFLRTKVHAQGPLDKDELRSEAEAAGYFAEGNGRTFHTTLMNIVRHGKVMQLPDGRYAFPSASESLFDQGKEDGMRTVM